MRRLAVVLAGLLAACTRTTSRNPPFPEYIEITPVMESVLQGSFPQLRNVEIAIYELHSDSVYLEARFTVASYFSRRLRYMILFNPEAFRRGVPLEGLRAIVAHELAHITYYESQSRMGLLSLTRLLLPYFNTEFERKADLDTISLGYAQGLKTYRTWLYRNIPANAAAEKKRDYYTPEEIEALLQAERDQPGVMKTFINCIPRNLSEIRYEERAPAGVCRP